MRRTRRSSRPSEYATSVFINGPFDAAYQQLFRAIVFTVIHCGFRARCALEIDDSGDVRIEEIFSIIEECGLGIHDSSRTELDHRTRLPRFNMPLELGMFLGAKRFGADQQRRKRCLVLDRTQHRFQKFISDIAGQDIKSHRKNERVAITQVRDWLSNCCNGRLPGGDHIGDQYRRFKTELPQLCGRLKLNPREMTFNDFAYIATDWLAAQSAG
jgi:hypothetical protein